MLTPKHPRDTFITIYGRKPVLEVLMNEALQVDKVAIAERAKGHIISDILSLAKKRDVSILRMEAKRISRLSRNEKQDQGVVADVVAPEMDSFERYLELLGTRKKNKETIHLMALNGVTTPRNVGMAMRSSTALGMGGLIYPRKGCPNISPLIVKASAGVIFKTRILRCEYLQQALEEAKKAGFCVYGLSGYGKHTLYGMPKFAKRSIFVLGGETAGIDEKVGKLVDEWLRIPMANGVESLNVACAATLVAGEVMRRMCEV